MLEKFFSFFTLGMMNKMFLSFILYSVMGWIAETLIHVFREKRAVKRGFLFGPICPIYGAGALILIVLLQGRTDNFFILFLAGFFICGILEYTVHFVLEKVFHAMWWDYSTRRFNIKGRVYLNGLLLMGLSSALLIKYVHPFVSDVLDMISPRALHITSFIIYSIFLFDIATTVADLKNSVAHLKNTLNRALKESQNFIDSTEATLNDVADTIKNNEKVREAIHRMNDENSPLSKFRKRFAGININKYKEILEIIRDKPDESKARTDIKIYGEKNDFEEEELGETEDNKVEEKEDGK